MGRPPIRIGGVLRCCIATADQISHDANVLQDGDTMHCTWCSGGLVFRDGAWEWPGPDFDWAQHTDDSEAIE